MKLLIISTNPFSKINNGKTYETILSHFEKNDLYSLFFRPHDDNIDYEYCNEYYAVSEANIISKIINPHKKCGGQVLLKENKKDSLFIDADKYHRIFRSSSIKQNRFLKDFLWNSNLWFTSELQEWLNSKQIDLILFHAPDYIGIHKVAVKIQMFLHVPMVTFITDDYILYNTGNIFNRYYKLLLKNTFTNTINKSKDTYCIGKLMAIHYSKTFKKNMKYVMNSVNLIPYDPKKPPKNPIISYFGGLHLNRWKMIAKLSHELKDYAIINIYTTTKLTEKIKASFCTNVVFCSCTQGEELIKSYKNSDILLHVEADDKKNISRTKLTVSTKIPEYLISSRLVLGVGPSQIASMLLLKENKIGIVIDSVLDIRNSKTIIKNTLDNYIEYNQIIESAYNYAKDNFEINNVSGYFYSDLKSLV